MYQKRLAEEVCGSVVTQHYSGPSQSVYLAPTTTGVLLYVKFSHVLAHIPLHFSKNSQKSILNFIIASYVFPWKIMKSHVMKPQAE